MVDPVEQPDSNVVYVQCLVVCGLWDEVCNVCVCGFVACILCFVSYVICFVLMDCCVGVLVCWCARCVQCDVETLSAAVEFVLL